MPISVRCNLKSLLGGASQVSGVLNVRRGRRGDFSPQVGCEEAVGLAYGGESGLQEVTHGRAVERLECQRVGDIRDLGDLTFDRLLVCNSRLRRQAEADA